jgi:hypothetical protein
MNWFNKYVSFVGYIIREIKPCCAYCKHLTLGKIYFYHDLSSRCKKTGVSCYFGIYQKIKELPKYPNLEEMNQLAIEHLKELGLVCNKYEKQDNG